MSSLMDLDSDGEVQEDTGGLLLRKARLPASSERMEAEIVELEPLQAGSMSSLLWAFLTPYCV